MVMVQDARRMGIPKKILDTIPYHRQGHRKLRFLQDIVAITNTQ